MAVADVNLTPNCWLTEDVYSTGSPAENGDIRSIQQVGKKDSASLKLEFRVLSQSGCTRVSLCRMWISDSRISQMHTQGKVGPLS